MVMRQMHKIRKVRKSDGFTAFYCGIAACPEIKQIKGGYLLRSSKLRQLTAKFTKDELKMLKIILKKYIK